MDQFDVVVIGAGAAGMMCAVEAGKRGRSVLVLDHAAKPGEKIRISGGGRCNFTNLNAAPGNFISQNPSFAISALRRYTQRDFIALVERYGIAYHEKTLGQLFCDGSSKQIIDLLLNEMRLGNVELRLSTSVESMEKAPEGFALKLSQGTVQCRSVVVATGGKSIPKMGATGFGYDLAQQFGLKIVETRPALVPLTLEPTLLERLTPLAGVSVDAVAGCRKTTFAEAMLFTHRGLSGPAILQISSYWREGDEIVLSMLPGVNLFEELRAARAQNGRQALQTALSAFLPKRLAQLIAETEKGPANLADYSDKRLRTIDEAVNRWRFKPAGSEGYRTAEVTLGGVDTRELDSRTMEAKAVPGLYFIGEVVDVTGWLGGYNFQWAWSSGWCAGQAV
ncbi:NAD(P)/FAD-dependent oxidoreductase [Microvirga tunisiensis]|uniref:NAD(P)/FAD-dependent oxidoreductase n=1 Tax=Microvirga tunisiensis TaxID=2108360 RepID=A0A5N7MSH8_9HYPH|nr:NAD(P)/FAD-dependent oxidoreductase [Microvirga tunisiensis]MPR11882.1 NAD(P)/FAD-dependent oxidoreductase [Microvirga tunisiensis]MPR29913.1 NAD(P)/FAD-dependent oxidoreductase [Microvirga tunisiensis]